MPQFDPNKFSISGAPVPGMFVQDNEELNKKLQQRAVNRVAAPPQQGQQGQSQQGQPGSIAVNLLQSPNVSGFVLPSDYGERSTREENTFADGYDPSSSNLAQHNSGEAAVAAQASGTPVRYDPYIDPYMRELDWKRQQLHDVMSDMQGKIADYHPSKMRGIMSKMAGIGMGAMTMNPEAGMKFGKEIQDQPLQRSLKPDQMLANSLELDMKNLHDISGLGATLTQRQAELNHSYAEQENARTTAQKEEDALAYPDQEKVETGEGTRMMPKRFKAGTTKMPKEGELVKGGSKFEPSEVQIEVTDDGRVMSLDKKTGQSKEIPLPAGVKIPSGAQTEFKQFIQNYLKGTPNATPQQIDLKMKEYFVDNRPDYNAAARAEKKTSETDAGTHAAAIAQSVDKLKLTDPDKAYEAANRKLDAASQLDPKIAAVKSEIQKQLRARFPKKSGGGGYTPVFPQSGTK